MANIKSAIKRARQAPKRRLHNMSMRSAMRTAAKRVLKAIHAGNHGHAMETFKSSQPLIDKAANKGLIHANKAARYKSRLNARIKRLVA